jgi:hypothetical protein
VTLACCVDCEDGTPRRDAILVRVIDQGSGPGHGVFACPEHARAHAARPGAPDWLRRAVAAQDAGEDR